MELAKYFAYLALVFTFVLPYSVKLISLYSEKAASIAGKVLGSVYINFTLGYVSYFVFGYFFSQINIERKKRWLIYLLGAVGLIITSFAQVIFPISDKGAVIVFIISFAISGILHQIPVLKKYIV